MTSFNEKEPCAGVPDTEKEPLFSAIPDLSDLSTLSALAEAFAAIPAVSGYEELASARAAEAVQDATGFFGECTALPAGGLLFRHRCKKKKSEGPAKTLLLDVHFDTVGFVVTELLPGGFLRVAAKGGVDRRLLFASELEIYGKKTIRGVFISTPPHLLKKGSDALPLPALSEILVDTGCSDESLRSLVRVGDPCGFVFSPKKLRNDTLCSRSMDNRICAAAVVYAAKLLERDSDYPDACDVLFSLSPAEEVNGTGGAYLGRLCADGAVVLDVNFGRDADIPAKVSYLPGQGCGVSYSCTTSRALTDALVRCAKENGIPLHTLVESENTGTNAHFLSNAYRGTPCAVLSIPEKYMHQANETVRLFDAAACARLIAAFAAVFPDFIENEARSRMLIPFEGGVGIE